MTSSDSLIYEKLTKQNVGKQITKNELQNYN